MTNIKQIDNGASKIGWNRRGRKLYKGGGRLNKPHTHTTRAKKNGKIYIYIYKKKTGDGGVTLRHQRVKKNRRDASSTTRKVGAKHFGVTRRKKKQENKRENLTNVHRFSPFTSFAPATIEI